MLCRRCFREQAPKIGFIHVCSVGTPFILVPLSEKVHVDLNSLVGLFVIRTSVLLRDDAMESRFSFLVPTLSRRHQPLNSARSTDCIVMESSKCLIINAIEPLYTCTLECVYPQIPCCDSVSVHFKPTMATRNLTPEFNKYRQASGRKRPMNTSSSANASLIGGES